jgi:hypothetical protein
VTFEFLTPVVLCVSFVEEAASAAETEKSVMCAQRWHKMMFQLAIVMCPINQRNVPPGSSLFFVGVKERNGHLLVLSDK